MRWLHRLRALLRNLLHGADVDRDLRDELEAYTGLVADEHRAAGLPSPAAERRARLELGGMAAVAGGVRAARAGASLGRFCMDVWHACRSLRRHPAYVAIAIATLTLGIGANTAIFSVVDAAVFKPLPYKDPDQLVEILQVLRPGTAEETRQLATTWTQLDTWRAHPEIFSALVTLSGPITVATIDGLPAGQAYVSRLSPDVTGVLGISPLIGRSFSEADVRAGSAVALLAEPFWRRAFRAAPSALGRPIAIDGRSYTVIGVTPAALSWKVGSSQVAAYLPYDEAAARSGRQWPFVNVVARLRPGLTLAQAERLLSHVGNGLQGSSSAADRWNVELMPLDRRLWTDDARSTRVALLILLGAVGCVLLITCANVANLLLARSVTHRRETAIRAALGATAARLASASLAEGLVLATCGGAGACGLVWLNTRMLPALAPSDLQLFEANPLAMDLRTLACGLLAVMLTAILCSILPCSILPAISAAHADFAEAFEGSRKVTGSTHRGRRVQATLQTGQVALTLVLLAGTGLLASSFVHMTTADPGYAVDRLASVSLDLPAARYPTAAAQAEMFDTLLTRVRLIPAIQAAYGEPVPSGFGGRLVPFGHERDPDLPRTVNEMYHVDPEYFALAGIPLRSGRLLRASDRARADSVAVIDERAAALFWPGASPLGQRFRESAFEPWSTVVGIVGHVKTRWFTYKNGTTQAYVLTAQNPITGHRSMLVRVPPGHDPSESLGAIRETIHAVDPSLEPVGMQRLADMYEDVLSPQRFFLTTMAVLAGVALITACVGLFGLLNYTVARRMPEMGVRMALGAQPRDVRSIILREALMPVGAGCAFGLAASWWLSRYLSSLLYKITPHDPFTFIAAIMVMFVVATLAAVPPIRRATRLDPLATLLFLEERAQRAAHRRWGDIGVGRRKARSASDARFWPVARRLPRF